MRVLVIVTLVVTTATGAVAQANPARQPRPANAAAGQTAASILVPIRILSDRIFLQAVSGKRVLWFLLDTGAPQSEMNLATADSLGVRRVGAADVTGGGPGTVAGAQLSGAEVHLQEDPTMRVSPTIGFPMARLGQADGMPLSGILGQDFVRQRVLEIDYAAGRMTLHDARTFRYEGTGTRIPLQFRDNFAHFNAELRLRDDSVVSADFIIDTGASGAVSLSHPLVQRYRLLERVGPTIQRQAGGVGGAASVNIGRLAALRLGAEEIKSPIVLLSSASGLRGAFFEGLVGGDLLRRFTVFLDYHRQEMILVPGTDRNEPFEADMSGAGFMSDNAGIRITNVMPDGPAALAGLAANDIITAIDGQSALAHGVGALRQRLRRDGGELVLTIRRGGDELRVRLRPRRLI